VNTSATVVLYILFMVGLLVIWWFLYRFVVRRAINRVIQTFRKRNAVSLNNAKTINELGIKSRDSMLKLGFRDYKPYALKLLKDANIVRETEDGKLYLSEEDIPEPLKKSLS